MPIYKLYFFAIPVNLCTISTTSVKENFVVIYLFHSKYFSRLTNIVKFFKFSSSTTTTNSPFKFFDQSFIFIYITT